MIPMVPPAARQSGTIPLPVAIERYFQVALFLLVLTGFGTLAGTGTLDAATVALVGVALLVRGYLLSQRIEAQIPARWTTYLTLAYAVFYLVDYLSISGGFLPATVHLVLFGMVVRLFSAQKERDHAMLAVLAFLMVLAAAVLTVDSVFLFAFAGFMLMAVATFVLMEMRRASRAATIQAREAADPKTYRKMAFSLAGTAPALVSLIVVAGFGFFFLLPRMSAGYLSSYAGGSDLSLGFSDRVQLGKIGQIQQSSSVVMHIQIDGDKVGSYDLRWRGVALADFDGKTWSSRIEQLPVFRQPDGRYPLGRERAGRGGAQTIHYRVLMEPIGTNVFFLANRPRYLSGNYRMVSADRGGSIYDLDVERPISLYEADSDLARPTAAELREAGAVYPAEVRGGYLQLPAELDPRVAELARETTTEANNSYDKAAALLQFLQTRYGYTLELPRTAPKDPLANFLFERKRGHCEYFASAMAVMLRTLGIPSRVVNGFRSSEFNDVTSSYVVRASSAHSWVEVYFPTYGWVEFDPTPAAGLEERTGWSRMMLYVDAMASFWREWVVNYDASHQKALGQDALQGTRSIADRMREWARQTYSHLLERARHLQRRISAAPGRWSLLGVAATLALVLLVNLRGLLRWVRQVRLEAHPEGAPSQAAALWYARMTGRLARRGVRKLPTQTAREFVAKIEEDALRMRVERFTEAYEAARFGESGSEAQRLPELYEEVIAGEKR